MLSSFIIQSKHRYKSRGIDTNIVRPQESTLVLRCKKCRQVVCRSDELEKHQQLASQVIRGKGLNIGKKVSC